MFFFKKQQTTAEYQKVVEEDNKYEQEQRDHELAVRLAREINEEVPPTPEPHRAPIVPVVAPAVSAGTGIDLSKWSYAQLRDTINSSTDIETLQACRNEFQKRLKAYYNWKQKYEGKAMPTGTAPPTGPSGATNVANVLPQQPSQAKLPAPISKPKFVQPVAKDRYFRIPFTRPGAKGKAKKKGLWWAHFDEQRVKRQLEVHPNAKPVMLLAGKHDAEMCDLSLSETGLTEKPGAEISKATFEEEWVRRYFSFYFIFHFFLKKKFFFLHYVGPLPVCPWQGRAHQEGRQHPGGCRLLEGRTVLFFSPSISGFVIFTFQYKNKTKNKQKQENLHTNF